MLLFSNLQFSGNISLVMRQLSNPMPVTVPDSSFVGNLIHPVVNYGLFMVQMGTASFTRMVDMAIVTAQLIYRQVHATDALDLLDCKHAVPMPCPKIYIS